MAGVLTYDEYVKAKESKSPKKDSDSVKVGREENSAQSLDILRDNEDSYFIHPDYPSVHKGTFEINGTPHTLEQGVIKTDVIAHIDELKRMGFSFMYRKKTDRRF